MEPVTFESLLHKKILVGMTYYAEDGTCIEQKQFWGTVISSGEHGIVIRLPNGDTKSLPPRPALHHRRKARRIQAALDRRGRHGPRLSVRLERDPLSPRPASPMPSTQCRPGRTPGSSR